LDNFRVRQELGEAKKATVASGSVPVVAKKRKKMAVRG
jgi:hypothetical protein